MDHSRDGGSEEGETHHEPAEPAGREGPLPTVAEPCQTQHPQHREQNQKRLQKQEPRLYQQSVICRSDGGGGTGQYQEPVDCLCERSGALKRSEQSLHMSHDHETSGRHEEKHGN